jgi:hypothetical protein
MLEHLFQGNERMFATYYTSPWFLVIWIETPASGDKIDSSGTYRDKYAYHKWQDVCKYVDTKCPLSLIII